MIDLVYDCDITMGIPGRDVDDGLALLYLLGSTDIRLLGVTKSLERIADHCTNVCEQVIYLEKGLIVRHLPEGWTKPAPTD